MSKHDQALPISPYLDQILTTFIQKKLLLLSAAPGAGKTTMLPWALLSRPEFKDQKILLLEPRRLAARAAANRISLLLGEKTGQTVGLRTRLETMVCPNTRLEVITEGVLIQMLQHHKSLDGYGTLLFDEFHTRSLQGDLGLTLAWAVRKKQRPDLAIALLSATLPSRELLNVFPDFPLIEVEAPSHPVEVSYRPPLSQQEKSWQGAARLCQEALQQLGSAASATVLCFLPGYYEMHQARALLAKPCAALGVALHLLHGQMPPQEQQIVLDPDRAHGRRIILSTNVAETSLTIPGVKAVVDMGLERRVRFRPRTGMDHWDTLPISMASAEQRKGRAGRLGPGLCLRWWQASDFHEPFALPEILEADLAPLALHIAAWGARAEKLTWLTPPPPASYSQAVGLLKNLGLLDASGEITPLGRKTSRFALHPRLARMILTFQTSALADTAVVTAALLESDEFSSRQHADFRDLLDDVKAWAQGRGQPHQPSFKKLWEECRRLYRTLGGTVGSPQAITLRPEAAGNVLLSAYPDRLAKRTRIDDPATSRCLLASGRGALLKGTMAREEFVVIADLDGGEQNARVFSAAPIAQKDILAHTAVTPQVFWSISWKGWTPKCKSELKIGAIALKDQPGALPDKPVLQDKALARMREKGLEQLPWNAVSENFLARCRFLEKSGQVKDWPAFDDEHLLANAAQWLLPAGRWNGTEVWNEQNLLHGLKLYLGEAHLARLNELAPDILRLPAGFKKMVNYTSGEVPKLSARVQEFFGCRTTPTVAGQPLMLDILSPANRTIQLTRDLANFWETTYPGIKKQFEAKYPKHPWPDDPGNKKYVKYK